jgi:multiple sugar transport system substrate-binding protein
VVVKFDSCELTTGRCYGTVSWFYLAAFCTLVMILAGCNSSGGKNSLPDVADRDDSAENSTATQKAREGSAPTQLKIIVIDDENLGFAIQRQLQARSTDTIEVLSIKATRPSEVEWQKLAADIAFYPPNWLGEMVQSNLISPVPEYVLKEEEVDERSELRLDREGIVKFGGKRFGFSMGSPKSIMLYRKDLLQRVKLKPPKTWREFELVWQEISDTKWEGKPEDFATSLEPLNGKWAGEALLSRAAPYIRTHGQFSALFNVRTMEPLIECEAYLKALQELVAANPQAKTESNRLTPEQVLQKFLGGDAAIAFGWPMRLPTDFIVPEPIAPHIESSVMPGSNTHFSVSAQRWESTAAEDSLTVPVIGFDGRMGSVLSNSRRSAAAFRRLVWLTDNKLSLQIAPESRCSAPFRVQHLSAAERWLGSSYPTAFVSSFQRTTEDQHQSSVWLSSPQFPGGAEYMDALSKGVHASLSGTDPKSALADVAKDWRSITERLGKEKQLEAYKASIQMR